MKQLREILQSGMQNQHKLNIEEKKNLRDIVTIQEVQDRARSLEAY